MRAVGVLSNSNVADQNMPLSKQRVCCLPKGSMTRHTATIYNFFSLTLESKTETTGQHSTYTIL